MQDGAGYGRVKRWRAGEAGADALDRPHKENAPKVCGVACLCVFAPEIRLCVGVFVCVCVCLRVCVCARSRRMCLRVRACVLTCIRVSERASVSVSVASTRARASVRVLTIVNG